ncbi:recombinase family protein [Nonomuraea sp. NPDC050328]|uniref:recombinase family protein n=1 Tax=Nonomuraea sp. NPDC050328 TaxID=3364361 RepID=UPI0037A5E871
MFDAPIDLSDLPGYQPAAASRPRTAFLGRCSTKDNQDPRSSLAGQLAEASRLLGPGEAFVAHFWDVESGMLGLDERSQICAEDYARLGVPVPRDGGLGELLEAVERGEVDRVACERIGRVARDMLPSLQIERHLLSRGVPIDCANEPQGGMTTGRLTTRRSAQMQAEIGRHELMEMSMRGQRQHAANGYRHGPPCYGYIAELDPDAPPPAGRFGERRPKMRLALHPDGRRADTVAQVFRMRRLERLGEQEIARRLARDLDRHPLADGQAMWCGRQVRRMLAQPKYTGYQVYGRRAGRQGRERPTPISAWVWSRRPAHPAIVTVEEWHQTQLVSAQLRASRSTGWDRVHAAAAERGIALLPVRENETHTMFLAGDRQIVVPRGGLPPVVADEVIALLEADR